MAHTRHLAAIMFADIVGYTAMMQEDEALAIQSRKKFKHKLEEALAAHEGKMIEFRGDGAMCSFTSTIEGVKAAIELQLEMRAGQEVPLRIGMHTGDVMVEEEILYGDVVNIASRMESFALPGSILISGKAYDDIKNQKDIKTVSMGTYVLKNVKEPVKIYAIGNPGLVIPEQYELEGKGKIAGEEKTIGKSVAVLPFVNMSSDPEQDYFGEGITEEIINSLTHIKDLKVASQTSSNYFKDGNNDRRSIGKKLNVGALVEGSIQKQGKTLRITARLVNVNDGFQLWSEHYDRKLDDIFAIQDEIAIAVTYNLKIKLFENDKANIQKKPTDHAQAYDLYLKGRFYLNRRGAGLKKGFEYFMQAVHLDPEFALPYAGMADAYSILAFYGAMPPHQAMPKAKENAEKAIQLDPLNTEGHTALAFISVFYDWNWEEARKRFQKVFEIDPNYAPAYYWYSYYLSFVEGRPEDGIREAKKAADLLEPLVSISHHVLSINYLNAGKYDSALQEAQLSIDLDANSFPGWRALGVSLALLERYDEAIEAFKTCLTLSNRHSWALGELSWVYSLTGETAESEKILDELVTRSKTEYLSWLFISGVAYFSKKYELSLEFLEKAFSERESTLVCIKIYPPCSFLNTDPRFKSYLDRIKFPGV